MNQSVTVNRMYKDTLFRQVFSGPRELLSLYNAVNNTTYEDETKLEINTLGSAVYLHMKNDVSFIFDFRMNVFEHQSTINPNMPLRNLVYISELYQAYLRQNRIGFYSSKAISIPAPRFIIFYNGLVEQPDEVIYKLSDLYECESDMLELKVIQYNVNEGHNKPLMKVCKTLDEYATFVAKVREYNENERIEDAVSRAVRYCIDHNILRDFLTKNEAEVSMGLLNEFDEELYKETMLSEGQELLAKAIECVNIGDTIDKMLKKGIPESTATRAMEIVASIKRG